MLEVQSKTIQWLLEKKNPSIRYLTLRHLLGHKDDHPEVIKARKAIPRDPWVRKLMKKQHREGYWANPKSSWFFKFGATVWHLQVLAELDMPGDDPRIRRASERFLTQHAMKDGGFSCGRYSRRFSEECVTGHMSYALLRFDYEDDQRVKAASEWLLAHQLPDGGWNCEHGPDVRHSSFVSALAALKGLSAVPRARRDRRHKRAIERGVEFLLLHQLFWSDRTGKPVMGGSPLRLRFPAHHAYDLLSAPRVLYLLGVSRDPRLDKALDLLEAKADGDGRWRVDRVPGSKKRTKSLIMRIEPEKRPSKWLTVNALIVLKHFGRINLETRSIPI